MNHALLLLALLLSGSSDRPGEDARAVFTGIAADGTILFGDRPSTVARQATRPAGRLRLPTANTMAPFVPTRADGAAAAPGPPPSPGRSEAADPPGDGAAGPEACQRLRIELAALWRERRQGYAAARGKALKRDIRRLQSAMKARCGSWR